MHNPVWFPVTGWMSRQTVFKCRDQQHQQQLLLTGCLCTPDQSGASSTETLHARSKTSEFLPEMMRTRTKSALSALELGIKRVGLPPRSYSLHPLSFFSMCPSTYMPPFVT